MKEKQIIIVTMQFPFGDSEPFLKVELEQLSRFFNRIYILPLHFDSSKPMQAIPNGTKVVDVNAIKGDTAKRNLLDYFFVSIVLLSELLNSLNARLLLRLRYHLSELFSYVNFAKKIKLAIESKEIEQGSNLYYSYWFDAGASVLSTFKRRYESNAVVVSRAHGFDLYEERNEHGYIFPRLFQIRGVNRVFTISQDGLLYLSKRYSALRSKLELSRLGTASAVNLQNGLQNNNKGLLLVSCSNMIPLKRVHLIIEVLRHCKGQIRWVHFGSGPLFQNLKDEAKRLPHNLVAEFRGSTDNKDVIQFYCENFVDWFINVSEAEGLPVSIMEALSFGVPAIATDVGGTREIVNEITGVLINKNFEPKMVAEIIESRVFSDQERQRIREFWSTNFSAEKNYNNFAKSLLALLG